ncbi:hypothetical protein [Nocardia sp. NPDC049149]|uniref:phthiocerol/phthiodiolone dimycocerosyl transferase family protein n=1 Tax=Nocardia sp. NPDC049149 TaxID=3364315 RepID=UPI00371F10E6
MPRKLTVNYVAMCAGEIDTALLSTAFEVLCRKYPMLRGTIELADGVAGLRVPGAGPGAAVTDIARGPIADWLAHGLTPLDPARTLAALTIVPEGETTAVALRVSHAINDATLGFTLLAHFWRTAAALAGTAAFPDSASVHPHSLEEAYRIRGAAMPELSGTAAGSVHSIAATESGDDTGFGSVPGERITLSQHDTDAMLAHARASGTTLHAMLAAAIIRAERATIAESACAGDQLPMIMFHLVDLRPHLRPAARPDEVTNALGFAPTVTACAPGDDLGALAMATKAQITGSIDRGDALAVMLAAASVAVRGGARKGVGNFITNWGVVPDLLVPPGMEIVDFRGFATSEPVSWVGYFVSTFAGRCSIELAFSPRFHPPAQIAELREFLIANLAQMIQQRRRRNS